MAARNNERLTFRLHRALANRHLQKTSGLSKILDKDVAVLKNIPYEILIDGREEFIKERRVSTIFDYELNYSLKGCENKYIKLQNHSIYLTVTNLPELRYLDLPVYGFNLNEHFKNISEIPKTILEWFSHDHYLIEFRSSDYNYMKLKRLCDILLAMYIGDVKEILKEDYENNEILSLLKCWDAKRFKKFLDYCIHKPQSIQMYLIFYTLITVLERNTTDSELIAESFRKMCTYCQYRNFSSFLPANYINFMMKHLKLSAKGPNPFGQHHNWLFAENLVAKKFYIGDKSSLKLLLRYNCPTIFHPSYAKKVFPRHFLPGIGYWPRKPAGCTSFNSLKYYVHLACLILSLLSIPPSAKKDNITDCIRLLWASLPTPIIPMADMQEFVRTTNVYFPWDGYFTLLRFYPLEYDIVYQPRSLQHLSRCAFVQNCHNPEGISSLLLPERLKRYLNFDI